MSTHCLHGTMLLLVGDFFHEPLGKYEERFVLCELQTTNTLFRCSKHISRQVRPRLKKECVFGTLSMADRQVIWSVEPIWLSPQRCPLTWNTACTISHQYIVRRRISGEGMQSWSLSYYQSTFTLGAISTMIQVVLVLLLVFDSILLSQRINRNGQVYPHFSK